MDQSLTIRTATLHDAPSLARLSDMLGYPATTDDMTGRLGRLLSSASDVVIVAEIPLSAVVGWLHGSQREVLEYGSRCEILGLVVAEEHRTLGIGRRLIAAVEAWATQRGLMSMVVRSNVTRVESHPFYEHLGYACIKTQHTYRKQLVS